MHGHALCPPLLVEPMDVPSEVPPNGVIPVVATVIRRGHHLLVGRRPLDKRHGGLWEFPGGKLEPGEDWAAGAARELLEELGLALVRAGDLVFAARDPTSPYRIVFMEVEVRGTIEPHEHIEIGWFTPSELAEMPLAPTDAAFVESLVGE